MSSVEGPGDGIDPQASNPRNEAVFEDLLSQTFPRMSPEARKNVARALWLSMFGVGVSSPLWYHQIIAALVP